MEDEGITSSVNEGAQETTEAAADDAFAEIREHYAATKELTEEETDKIADVAVGYLRDILGFFGEDKSSIDEYDGDEGELILDINGGNLAVLIGRHGRTLDALQMVLSSLMSSNLKFHYPVVVDIEGYKSRRKDKVRTIALCRRPREAAGERSLPGADERLRAQARAHCARGR